MKFGENNAVIMEDGTVYDAYAGCVALHPEGHIVGGFQNAIHDNSKKTFDGRRVPDSLKMPVHHRIEIAEHQIALWSHYAAQQRAVQAKAKKPKARKKPCRAKEPT